jgi:hypothetical protein
MRRHLVAKEKVIAEIDLDVQSERQDEELDEN